MKTKKWKKIFSSVLIATMCFSMFTTNTSAETKDVVNGYYDNNVWKEGELVQTLPKGISVDKTAKKIDKNKYQINLKLSTEKKKDSIINKAATVLVLDTSGSMGDDKKLESEKNSAKNFIKIYGGSKEREGRYIAIVEFNENSNIVLSWTDIANSKGRMKAYEAIDSLEARGGTNLQAGLRRVNELFNIDNIKTIKNKDTIVLTDGVPTYCLNKEGLTEGKGYEGSEYIIENTKEEGDILQKKSSIYTICYGVENDYTYKKDYWFGEDEYGPTVGEFLTTSIASEPEKAYNTDNIVQLNNAFDDITSEIISGIDGKSLKVVDNNTSFVKITSEFQDDVTLNDNGGFIWDLSKTTPKIEEKDGKTIYTYENTYEILLDADDVNFKEDVYYPLNGETYVMIGNQKVEFPIPAAKGEKTKYKVLYKDGLNGEIFKKENLIYGEKTPIIENPKRKGYKFVGWNPKVDEIVTKDAVYVAKWEKNNTESITPNISNRIIETSRIEGDNRIETAVQASKTLYPNGTNSVVLANCDRYTDVLTANPFSIQENASLLYTYKDKLPEKTLEEIERLGAKQIYISGGYEAVSKKVVDQLKNKGYSIYRFDGKNRYDTARKIATKIREKGNTKVSEIASGENYPDALSMTPMAVKDNAPILLTKKDSIPMYTKQALADWDIETIKIAGLNEAVSAKVEKQIKDGFTIDKTSNVYDGAKLIRRFGGANRYETSVILAKNTLPESTLGVYVTGENFPDALIAGNYAGRRNVPIILVKRDTLPASVAKYTKNSNIQRVTLIGGVNAISNHVYQLIKEAVR